MKCATKGCGSSVTNEWDIWCPACYDAQMAEADHIDAVVDSLEEGEQPYEGTDAVFAYDYGEAAR